MNRNLDVSDNNDCGSRSKTRFYSVSMYENTEPACNDDRDDNNQEGSEHSLAEDDGGDYELAAETSSVSSAEYGSFVSGEQNTITAVRVRPMLSSEKKNGYRSIVDMNVNNDYLVTRIMNPIGLSASQKHATTDATTFPAQITQEFRFDYSYWSFGRSSALPKATQTMIYEDLGALALGAVLQGQNCSLFACGQPGAGKTYTMMGSAAERVKAGPSTLLTSERSGLIPRICRGLFDEIGQGNTQNNSPTLIMSYVEIYDERVYDLLSHTSAKTSLKVREHPEEGAFVERAQRVHVTSYSQAMQLIEEGTRSVSSQGTCRPASSHTVLILSLIQNALTDHDSMSSTGSFQKSLKSKLCLVDLAGSERTDHSGVHGLSLREAASINRSLATLSDVVYASAKRQSNRSVDGTQHHKVFIPYRNSVLTRLLKECLGRRAKTIMLGAISPCCAHYEESIATLRYIERAKSVSGTVRAHLDGNGDTIQQFLNEASELKSSLRDCAVGNVPPAIGDKSRGTPKCHDDCSDGESYDQRLSSDNSQEAEVELSTSECELHLEARIVDRQQENASDQTVPRSVALLKLVAILRHYQTIRKYRAVSRWRKFVVWRAQTSRVLSPQVDKQERGPSKHNDSMTPSPSNSRKVGFPPLHTSVSVPETQTGGRVQDVVAAVVATDAICCSVVQEFLFPRSKAVSKVSIQRHTTTSTSLLELLASSSDYDRSEFDLNCSYSELQLDNIAADSLCTFSDEFSAQFDRLENEEGLSKATRYEENTPLSSLSLCIDSLDLARRTLGPCDRNLRLQNNDDKRIPSGSIGVERELLRYLDKRFIVMTRRLADLTVAVQSHADVTSQSCCGILESIVGEFCMQIIPRLCSQLPSASSACVAGRLQLETQLEQYSERVKRLLPELALESVGMDIGLVESDGDAVFSVATDLLVTNERVKLVWKFAEQKKRERLLQVQSLEATTIKDRKIAARIAALEERNADLSVRCDVLAAKSQQFGEATQREMELTNHPPTNQSECDTNEPVGPLEAEYDDTSAVSSMGSLGSKLAVEIARTRDVQARNDELLCCFATLNRGLAAASTRVSVLEADNSRLGAELQYLAESSTKNTAANSQTTLVALEVLQDRVVSLQMDLENANIRALDLEGQLIALKNTNLEPIFELQSVNATVTCEKETQKSVKAELELLKVHAEAKIEALRQQLNDAEAKIKELKEADAMKHEERLQALNETQLIYEAKNSELSASLVQAQTEIVEKTYRAEHENAHHLAVIEGLNTDLHQAQTQRELAEMLAAESISKMETLRAHVSEQADQICELKARGYEDEEIIRELQTKITAVLSEKEEQTLLLAETEEALASACGREKDLTYQLEASSTQKLNEMNCVRRELHEATIEIASLREELTELLDHSTLQSAAIEMLGLEQTDAMSRADELEQERNELVSRFECEHSLFEQNREQERQAAELQAQYAELLRKLERDLETERQGSMAMYEAWQHQMDAFIEFHCKNTRDMEVSTTASSVSARESNPEVTTEGNELESADEATDARISKQKEQTTSVETRADVCTDGAENTVNEHLSSVDAWFEELISGGQAPLSSESAEESGNTLDEDYVARSSMLTTITELSALTTELLVVCEAPQTDDQLTIETTIDKEGHHHDASINTNSLMETEKLQKGVSGTKESTIHTKKTSSEVIQLRKIVTKLKGALDEKDDMLLVLDGKIQLGGANDGLCHFLSFGGFEMFLDCGVKLQSLHCETQADGHVVYRLELPALNSVDVGALDVVLLSNHLTLLALPLLTEVLGFKGQIYATQLTLDFGRVFMEELAALAQGDNTAFFTFEALCDGTETELPIFSLENIERCCKKIHCVEYSEVIPLAYGIQVTALSSGYALGASIWLVEGPNDRLAYVAASSGDYNRHPKELDLLPLVDCETLLLTDLKPDRDPHANTERMVERVLSGVSRVLERGGVCIVPTSPCGVVFDLVEAVYAACLHNKQNVPMYFISDHASRVMELTQLGAEWLCEKKIEKLYAGEDAFLHESLLKTNVFHAIADVSAATAATFQNGSILFVGHPSLQFGRAPELIQMLGNDSRNAVLLIDPSIDAAEAFAPFQNLQLEKISCPIDPRLSCGDANQFIARCCPHNLIIPYEYTIPPAASAMEGAEMSSHFSRVLPLHELTAAKAKTELLTFPMKQFEPIVIEKASKYLDGRLDPKLAAQATITDVNGKAAACVNGVLNVKRKAFVLEPLTVISPVPSTSDVNDESKLKGSKRKALAISDSDASSNLQSIDYKEKSSLLLGQVDEDKLMKQVKTHDPQAQVYISQGQGDADVFMSIPSLDARVTLWKETGKTLVETEKEDARALLTSFILAQLVVITQA